MWSYKDNQGRIHTRLSPAQIRSFISDHTIKEETLLLNSQFNKWVRARETLFFKVTTAELPSQRSIEKASNKFSENPVLANNQSYKTGNIKQLIIVTLLALIAVLSMSYQLSAIYKKEQHLDKLENAYISHKDITNDQKMAKTAHLDAKTRYNEIYRTISSAVTQEDKDREDNIYNLAKKEMLEANIRYQNFNYVEPQTTLPISIKRAKKELLIMRNGIFYYVLAIVPLYLYSIFIHFKACKVVFSKGKRYLFIWLLHSIPLLQFFFYAILSAKWNLESTQRKNSLYYTLPLTICLLLSVSFSFYFFYYKTSHSLILILFSIVLWAILQFRQISMIRYAIK